MFQPWMFVAMEENGYTDTPDGVINRVADALLNSGKPIIDENTFREACISCDVDPDSFTQEDFEKLKQRLR